jgi:ring-1,2-phenylacetyl-CoA epoxidase subunit PaaE
VTAPRFHRLKVADVRRETDEAVSIAFTVPPELAAAYTFEPGQYLTLRADIEGEDTRRSYSICSGLDEAELRVAVKEVEGGLFSSFANRSIKTGDAIDVMTPMGRFTAPPAADGSRVFVGIACGSGITPIMSLIRSVLAREPKSRFVLLYGNRTTRSIIFKEALDDLKDRYLGRLAVHHVLSREAQDIALLNGRLDASRITTLLRASLPDQDIDHIFLCGPMGMLEAARGALATLGVPADRIHVELFTPAEPARSPRIEQSPQDRNAAEARPAVATATVTLDGTTHVFPVAAQEGIVDAGLRAGLELPFSCKGGMCCTCRAKLVSGHVRMVQNYSLEPWEMEKGFVLACQSRPTTETVVLDFDQT